MDHWFLVGRDIMWFIFGASPVIFGVAAGKNADDKSDGMKSSQYFSLAVLLQIAVIVVARSL